MDRGGLQGLVTYRTLLRREGGKPATYDAAVAASGAHKLVSEGAHLFSREGAAVAAAAVADARGWIRGGQNGERAVALAADGEQLVDAGYARLQRACLLWWQVDGEGEMTAVELGLAA